MNTKRVKVSDLIDDFLEHRDTVMSSNDLMSITLSYPGKPKSGSGVGRGVEAWVTGG